MFVSKVAALAAECRRIGVSGSVSRLGRAAKVKLDMAALEGLRLVFGFDRWHARSPDSARPYRAQLAGIVNRLRPSCVVEVGCGLGGILARIHAEARHGYDHDPAAIRAARFLHHDINFTVGGFENIDEKRIDVLIAVNWIHGASPVQIEQWFAQLLPRTGFLLVDTVAAGTDGYPYFHDFQFLENKATKTVFECAAEPHRHFILWEMRNA